MCIVDSEEENAMKEAIIASFQSSLPWSERPDIVAEAAPMAPELPSSQVAAIQAKHKQKRDLNENIKKFTKGLRNDLDFLETDSGKKNKKKDDGGGGGEKKKILSRSQHKRKGKDTKYGFGGKKRGMKENTTESTFDGSGKSNFKGKNKGRINKNKRMSSKK